MKRDELIDIGLKIVALECSDDELDKLHELFSANVPHPDGSTLFYYPENYNARRDDITEYNPSVEEVVDVALAHKPILL